MFFTKPASLESNYSSNLNNEGGTESELAELASQLQYRHGRIVSMAACLVSLTIRLFSAKSVGSAPLADAMVNLQRECVIDWLQSHGVEKDRLESALIGLERAAETADYLSKLPD